MSESKITTIQELQEKIDTLLFTYTNMWGEFGSAGQKVIPFIYMQCMSHLEMLLRTRKPEEQDTDIIKEFRDFCEVSASAHKRAEWVRDAYGKVVHVFFARICRELGSAPTYWWHDTGNIL